ncbi:MAG TPA: site-2 protease family protein [Gemmatimonadaceae bacterium]|nr:site-2 protease family protein [Gemmatimonadaceae bacterium]
MDKVGNFLLLAPVLLFSIIAHEYAHGYAALKQGDPTAYQLGRLTWNPIKHIDPFLSILLPILTFYVGGFMFGGAKPVPVNPRNYRNFKKGDIIVSLAGVAVNFIIALGCIALVVIIGMIGRRAQTALPELVLLQTMMLYGVMINIVLAIFNLVPIPPLDGSHVMKYLLPPAWALQYQRAGQFGLIIVFAVLLFAPGLVFAPIRLVSRVALGGWVQPFLLTGGF